MTKHLFFYSFWHLPGLKMLGLGRTTVMDRFISSTVAGIITVIDKVIMRLALGRRLG